VSEELAGVPTPVVPAAHGMDTPQPRRTAAPFKHRWPKGTRIRLNSAYYGIPAAPNTRIHRVWMTIKEYLKPAQEIDRTTLTKDITLLLNLDPKKGDLSPVITHLLKLHCLVAVDNPAR
jgi:hypothetical protein